MRSLYHTFLQDLCIFLEFSLTVHSFITVHTYYFHSFQGASEPESCLQIYGERRMAITIAASAAVSIEDANRDIMSAEGKNAAAKQTYSFLAPLTNEQPCEAGR